MSIATIKIKFLEEFMTVQDEQLIRKLYETLHNEHQGKQTRLADFVGIWTDEEAAQIQKAVDECRTIDTNEW